MSKHLAIAFGVAVALGAVADRAAAQPRVIEIPREQLPTVPPVPGWQSEEIRARIREEAELAEIQLETRKEQLKAAQVRLDVAQQRLAVVQKGGASVPERDLVEARTAVDLARAELDIRRAELREAEMRATVARRRLESGVYPLVLTPVPAASAGTPPTGLRTTDAERARLAAKVQAKLAEVEKASAAVTAARADHDRVKALYDRQAATRADLDAAAARLTAAEADLKRAVAEAAAAELELKSLGTPPVGVVLPEENPGPYAVPPSSRPNR